MDESHMPGGVLDRYNDCAAALWGIKIYMLPQDREKN